MNQGPHTRVAITGAAGFLGHHLVRTWRAQGASVIPLVREVDSRAPEGSLALETVMTEPHHLVGVDVLIHAAAIRHRHGVRAAEYRASNVDLVSRLLEACAGRVERFVLVSSVGVYGFPQELPISEAHPFAPRTLYSATKVEAEKVARDRAAKLGVDLVIVRPTITYGPGDTNGMLDKMARMIRAGSYRIVGRGDNTLHHTHVRDMVRGIQLAATHDAARGDHFILAGPETISLRDLSALVAEAVHHPLSRVHIPLTIARRAADLVDLLQYRDLAFTKREPPINNEKLDVMTLPMAFDIHKARRVLGFVPEVGYREGVVETLRSA